MSIIYEHLILEALSEENMVSQLDTLSKEGWEVVGGISTVIYRDTLELRQLIRKELKDENIS